MAIISPSPRFRAFDSSGATLVGGQLFTYLAGTSTPQSTYTDSTGATPNTNPVILDAAGYADVWLGNAKYKYVLKDVNNVVLWTVDNIDGTSANNGTAAWTSHAVTDGQAAAVLTGETVDSVTYSSAIYDVQIVRGTTVFATGELAMQNLNGTWVASTGLFLSSTPHGVTFSVTQVGTVGTLNAALDSGAGNGTIKLSRRLVPA